MRMETGERKQQTNNNEQEEEKNKQICTNEWTRFSLFSIYVVEYTADP